MRKTTLGFRLLILLPVILLVLLLSWLAFDLWKVKGQVKASDQALATAEALRAEAESEALTQAERPEVTTIAATQETVPEETEPEDPFIHLVFAGDVLLSNHVTNAYDNAGGIQGVLDDGFRAEIEASDIFMVNEEFPFSDRGKAAADKQFTFRLPPARVSMLTELGIDIVTLANNHSLDFGTDALTDTCETLDKAGIRYVGAGPSMDRARQLEVMDVRGRRIGFLGASRVYPSADWVANSHKPGMVSGYDPAVLLEEVKAAEDFCDYLVVYVHWGIEKDDMPQEYQRTLGKKLIDAGADIVIGSHPHVLQGFEYYNGKPIVYSLGNFIFGSSIPKTALLKVDVDLDTDSSALTLVPGTSAAGYTRMLTDPADIGDFYQYIQGISFDVALDESGHIQH